MKNKKEKQQVEKQPKEKKKNKGLLIVGEVFFWTIISLFVAFFIWNGIDQNTGYRAPIFGFRMSVIVSPSMETANEENTYLTDSMKRIKKYDVITTKVVPYSEIQLYDVVTYHSSNGLICHRVVDKYEDGGKQYLVTRGDANNVNDTPISYSAVRGKVVNVTPNVGRVLLFIQSPYFLLGFFGSAFFILLGIYIFKRGQGKKKEQIPAKQEVVSEQHPLDVQEEQPQEEVQPEQPYVPGELVELEPVKEQDNEGFAKGPELQMLDDSPVVEEPKEEKAPAKKAKEEPKPEPQPEPEEEPQEPVGLVELEPVKDEPYEELPVEEEKPAPKKTEKKDQSKSEPKPEPKKAEEKKEEPKKEAPVKKAAPEKKPEPKAEPKEEKEKPTHRNYHVSKRAEDGKWTVKFAGGEKVIKLFNTQKEAMEYTKKMAENQGGAVLLHNSKGANKGRIKKK